MYHLRRSVAKGCKRTCSLQLPQATIMVADQREMGILLLPSLQRNWNLPEVSQLNSSVAAAASSLVALSFLLRTTGSISWNLSVGFSLNSVLLPPGPT